MTLAGRPCCAPGSSFRRTAGGIKCVGFLLFSNQRVAENPAGVGDAKDLVKAIVESAASLPIQKQIRQHAIGAVTIGKALTGFRQFQESEVRYRPEALQALQAEKDKVLEAAFPLLQQADGGNGSKEAQAAGGKPSPHRLVVHRSPCSQYRFT